MEVNYPQNIKQTASSNEGWSEDAHTIKSLEHFSGTFAVASTYNIKNSCVLPTVAVVLSSAQIVCVHYPSMEREHKMFLLMTTCSTITMVSWTLFNFQLAFNTYSYVLLSQHQQLSLPLVRISAYSSNASLPDTADLFLDFLLQIVPLELHHCN